MLTFKDWLHQVKGIDFNEEPLDSAQVAGYPRKLLDGGTMVKRMDQKPIVVGNDLKPKGKKGKKKAKPKTRDMKKDFHDL